MPSIWNWLAVLLCTQELAGTLGQSPFQGADFHVDEHSESLTAQFSTSYGPILGAVAYHNTTAVNVFRSIPYSAPPVGALRFEDPTPPQRWESARLTSQYPHICPQFDGQNGTVGAEDCLYLYLYTTSVPFSGDAKPVMLWVHGGGLASGDGLVTRNPIAGGMYDGRALAAEHGVVVVSVQYRLGTLGFLGVPDSEYGIGNFGLKDQRMAMQWVQDNAVHFGGDPKRVMIFGESAGGISMCYHLTSPASAGLFSSLAMESGSCNMQVQSAEAAGAVALSFAERVGCVQDDAWERKECLKAVPFAELTYPLGPNQTVLLPGSTYWAAPAFPWCMTVDGQWNGLLDTPIELLRWGEFNRVNAILGTNTNEFQCACTNGQNVSDCLFADILAQVLPGLGSAPYNLSAVRAILDHFLQHQLDDYSFHSALQLYSRHMPSSLELISAMLVDSRGWIGSCQTQLAGELMAAWGHSALWLYHFDYLGNASHVGHFSEVPFVFGNCGSCGLQGEQSCCQHSLETSKEASVSANMQQYWTSLARHGDPSEGVSPELPLWPPFDSGGKIMRFAEGLPAVDARYRSKFCQFWSLVLDGGFRNRTSP